MSITALLITHNQREGCPLIRAYTQIASKTHKVQRANRAYMPQEINKIVQSPK